MHAYILWNIPPEVFSAGPFTLRWNALLILVAYLAGRRLLLYLSTKDGVASRDVAVLTAYVILSGIALARLVYVAVNDPTLFWTNPLEILFPISFRPEFHLSDSAGFSAHGAALGVIAAVWLYKRRASAAPHFLKILDRLSIVAALTAFFLYSGSLLSSGIPGKPTASNAGIILVQPLVRGLETLPCCNMRNPGGANPLSGVIARKDHTVARADSIYQGVILYLFFKAGATEQLVNEFLIGDVKTFLFDMSAYVQEPGTEPLHYSIIVAKDKQYIGRVQTRGIARYPVHLIGAFASLALFVLLLALWYKRRQALFRGRVFAIFMIVFWAVSLVIGFMSENRSGADTTLDIAGILAGMVVAAFPARRESVPPGTKKSGLV